MTVSLTWVDAFTDTRFAGNPAGVCLLDAPLTAPTMQSLARVGYRRDRVRHPHRRARHFDLRWFSPAGRDRPVRPRHPGLGPRAAGRGSGGRHRTGDVRHRSGPLRASFVGDLIELDFPADTLSTAAPARAAHGPMGSAPTSSASGAPRFFVVVVLASEAAVRQLPTRSGGHRRHRQPRRSCSPRPPIPAPGRDYVLRVFGPNVGIDEDPATGSAQCVAGPYWSGRPRPARPGGAPALPRGAVLHVRPDGDRVHIGGNAVTVFTGHLC